jgi:hypothetical protein
MVARFERTKGNRGTLSCRGFPERVGAHVSSEARVTRARNELRAGLRGGSAVPLAPGFGGSFPGYPFVPLRATFPLDAENVARDSEGTLVLHGS